MRKLGYCKNLIESQEIVSSQKKKNTLVLHEQQTDIYDSKTIYDYLNSTRIYHNVWADFLNR